MLKERETAAIDSLLFFTTYPFISPATMSLPTEFTLNNGKKIPSVGLVSRRAVESGERGGGYSHAIRALSVAS